MLKVDRNKFIGFFYKGAVVLFIIIGFLLFVMEFQYKSIVVLLLTSLIGSFLFMGKIAENNNRETFGRWKFVEEFKGYRK